MSQVYEISPPTEFLPFTNLDVHPHAVQTDSQVWVAAKKAFLLAAAALVTGNDAAFLSSFDLWLAICDWKDQNSNTGSTLSDHLF